MRRARYLFKIFVNVFFTLATKAITQSVLSILRIFMCFSLPQDLLQLQYEGVAVMNMFDRRAKVNVNLLIFLLNQKFYGKSIETGLKKWDLRTQQFLIDCGNISWSLNVRFVVLYILHLI